MVRDKIDKLGYEYLGRQYLYLNVLGDVLSFVKNSLMQMIREQWHEEGSKETLEYWPREGEKQREEHPS